MKSIFTYLFILNSVFFLNAQNANISPEGGEFKFKKNQVNCLTKEQTQDIIKELEKNILLLKSQNKLTFVEKNNIPNPLFIWPVKKADGLNYNSPWAISNYVDHDLTYPNQLEDYTGGTKTYDTESGYNHQGIDIFTWPFTWKMMDNNEVEIIAASDGQIVAKGDGQFDKNCGFNDLPWNAIYVQHGDGSIAWYGHMKSGSLTTKNVGDMVSQGEFLGVIGSSGSSTGPHLHFQVWEDSSSGNLIDPYSGPSNTWNTDSWWQNQKPYLNPKINAVLTHTADPDFGDCPTTEVTNESDEFSSGQTIFFTVFLRDQVPGSSLNLKIIRPNNTVLYNWNYTLIDNYLTSWWRWSFPLPEDGQWKWQVTYLGEVVTHPFQVGTLGVDDEILEQTIVYPNPFENRITIDSESKITQITLRDVLGKTIRKQKNTREGIKTIDNISLSKGIYFLTLKNDLDQSKTIKLIKK